MNRASTSLGQKMRAGFRLVRNSRFLRNVGVLTVGNVSLAVMNFVQGIAVARMLGPTEYGLAALVMSYPSLLFSFFDASPAETAVKYLTVFWAERDRLRMSALVQLTCLVDLGVAAVALLLVLVSGAWAARAIVHSSVYLPLMYVFSAAYILNSTKDTAYAVLSVQGRFRMASLLIMLASLLRTAAILLLVRLGYGVPGVIWGNVFGLAMEGAVFGIVGIYFIRRDWGLRWTWGFWKPLHGFRREVVRFLAFNDVITLLALIPKQADILFLGHFRGPSEVGYYRLAKAFAAVLGYVVNPLQSVTYPRLMKLRTESSPADFWKLISRLTWQIGVPLGVLAAIGGSVLLPWILPRLAGQIYIPAVFPSQLLYLTACFWLAFFWVRPTFLVLGKMKELTVIFTVLALVTTPVYFLAAAKWGGNGIAGSYLLLGGPMVYAAFLLTLSAWRRQESSPTASNKLATV